MIINLDEVADLKKQWNNKKIGLVTGCFDILHLGHINLFKFAKDHVDILLVGVDSDASVKTHKRNHPYFNQQTRMEVVDAISFVDYTLLVDHGLRSDNPNINQFFINLYKRLGVTDIITDKQTDNYYKEKESRASILGINAILRNEDRFSSSSKIITDLGL